MKKIEFSKNVVVAYIAVLVLLLMQAVFNEDISIKNNFIIKAIYMIFPLAGLIYGYISSKYYINLHISFGKTRLEVFIEFIKNMAFGLLFALSINLVAIIYNLILYSYNSFSEVFTSKYLLLFVSSFLLQTSLGFFQGLFKLKTYLFIIILVIINVFTNILDLFNIESYIISIIYLSISLVIIYFNYYIIKRIKI